MRENLRNKIFLIIVSVFTAIFPFTLFFDVLKRKVVKDSIDGPKKVIEYYNLVSIKGLSNFVFAFCMIIFILSLVVAVIGFIDMAKKKYFTLYYRIIFSTLVVSLSLIVFFLSYYLMVVLFMLIASHMFLVYYDIRTNKRKLSNALIYACTYTAFLIFMIVGFACCPTA
jgi:hypothetical protein